MPSSIGIIQDEKQTGNGHKVVVHDGLPFGRETAGARRGPKDRPRHSPAVGAAASQLHSDSAGNRDERLEPESDPDSASQVSTGVHHHSLASRAGSAADAEVSGQNRVGSHSTLGDVRGCPDSGLAVVGGM
jgi:hypothetical protein